MRKRSEPHSFEQRLEEHRSRLEAEAAKLPHGSERDAVMKQIELLQTAADMNMWLSLGALPARALAAVPAIRRSGLSRSAG